MAAEIDKEGPEIQDDALLDKIETLYRQADELSARLQPSSSVKSQDATRLPIIGSLPVTAADKKNAAPSQKNNLQSSSSMSEADVMTTVVLTGIVSRPGSEHSHDNTTLLAGKHLEKSFPSSSSEDPFIAIKNAVEIAGRSNYENDDDLASEPAKGKNTSQSLDLAHALAEIIKQQIDSAIDTRFAATQEAVNKQISDNSDSAVALNKNLEPKRQAAQFVLKKAARIAQKTKNRRTNSKPVKKTKPTTNTNAKNTQPLVKPVRRQMKKTTNTKDD